MLSLIWSENIWIIFITKMKSSSSSIKEIIRDAKKGKMFILVDNKDRENEGDLVVPASKINPKKILLFDYGYEQDNRDKRMYSSLLRTYKNHHLSVDPIEDSGNIDITYDVNFSSISRQLITLGYKVTLKLQRDFLLDNGFNIFFDKLQHKYITAEGIEKLKINSELSGLKAIVDSNGLGGFYCLIAEKL